jgi:HEAT repeat protein
MYCAALEKRYALAAAATGKECLEVLAEGRPDVLILDLALRDSSAFAILDRLRREGGHTAVVVIAGDIAREAIDRLAGYGPAAVLVKPVKLRELCAQVAKAVAAARGRLRGKAPPAEPSFVERAERQEAAERSRVDLAALAARLLEHRGAQEAALYARRINSGTPNQAVGVIRELFAKLSEAEAWSLAIWAFKEGDHRVRILAAELVRGRFAAERAAELLTRFAADPDYRVRIAALRELAAGAAPGAGEFLARFLADESWKVRREAARGLEALAAGGVSEPLVGYYARNGIPPPLYLQKAVKGPNPAGAVKALESAAASGSSRVREYVAGVLAQAESKLVIPTLLKLLEDAHPAVRTAAARALAGFPSDKVRERLFAALTDDRFGVLKAVAETLGSFPLQPAALGLAKLFSASGKRVPKAAAEFIARCDSAANAFEQALLRLDAQDEPTRGVLALVLKRLYNEDAALGRAMVRLRSADREDAGRAAVEVAGELARFLQS